MVAYDLFEALHIEIVMADRTGWWLLSSERLGYTLHNECANLHTCKHMPKL